MKLTRIFSFLAASLAIIAPGTAHAEAKDHGVEPWTEAIASVSDFEPATRLFREVGDWQLRLSGEMDESELRYWKLSEEASGRFELWCAPKADTGCIRFVRLSGVEQKPIRIGARAWDTGGIYSVMVRSDNIPDLFARALKLGWWSESEPVRFQFGTSDLRNIVLVGPHGINLAVYERISPDFADFPVGRISQAFNSMRMVRDRHVSERFYSETLGFDTLFSGNSEPADPTPSNFGIPLNYTPDIKRGAAALQPSLPGETGRVEVMQIEGFTGADHADRASLPNLGHISVRYPVRDLDGYRAELESKGLTAAYEAKGVRIDGLGPVDLFAIRDPDGNITEFYRAQ
ncbi:VOC family protein [Altererythrobacter sp. MF3-039]|uniref:VOC family protein n=1 Tax=Altererythrobacter sp. MF3-039 TaxID=3252901 RepID=UPI00390C471B